MCKFARWAGRFFIIFILQYDGKRNTLFPKRMKHLRAEERIYIYLVYLCTYGVCVYSHTHARCLSKCTSAFICKFHIKYTFNVCWQWLNYTRWVSVRVSVFVCTYERKQIARFQPLTWFDLLLLAHSFTYSLTHSLIHSHTRTLATITKYLIFTLFTNCNFMHGSNIKCAL